MDSKGTILGRLTEAAALLFDGPEIIDPNYDAILVSPFNIEVEEDETLNILLRFKQVATSISLSRHVEYTDTVKQDLDYLFTGPPLDGRSYSVYIDPGDDEPKFPLVEQAMRNVPENQLSRILVRVVNDNDPDENMGPDDRTPRLWALEFHLDSRFYTKDSARLLAPALCTLLERWPSPISHRAWAPWTQNAVLVVVATRHVNKQNATSSSSMMLPILAYSPPSSSRQAGRSWGSYEARITSISPRDGTMEQMGLSVNAEELPSNTHLPAAPSYAQFTSVRQAKASGRQGKAEKQPQTNEATPEDHERAQQLLKYIV